MGGASTTNHQQLVPRSNVFGHALVRLDQAHGSTPLQNAIFAALDEPRRALATAVAFSGENQSNFFGEEKKEGHGESEMNCQRLQNVVQVVWIGHSVLRHQQENFGHEEEVDRDGDLSLFNKVGRHVAQLVRPEEHGHKKAERNWKERKKEEERKEIDTKTDPQTNKRGIDVIPRTPAVPREVIGNILRECTVCFLRSISM